MIGLVQLLTEASVHLPLEIASNTALRIGRDFFNRADSSADKSLQAAAHCFALVQPPSAAALKEANLIKVTLGTHAQPQLQRLGGRPPARLARRYRALSAVGAWLGVRS